MLVLVDFGEVHAIGVLQAGDDASAVLDLEVGTKNFDVEEFALAGAGAIGANVVESLVATVRVQEFLDGSVHEQGLSKQEAHRGIQEMP
jgi:hypothetical protein